jgi:gliding motility-associated-like protein
MNATGSTGLSASDFDISEDPGCDPGENAYCSQVNLVAGQYYALLIDNATSNAGFSLAFGGTSQFTGPDPNFTNTSLVICEGQTVTFDGATSTNVPGGLAWVFSTGSSPTSATGAGPHTVTYASAGNYVAILTGTDATGCQDVQTANITVNACGCSVTASNSGNVCAGTSTFDLSSTTVTGATYSWTGPGGFTAATQNPTGVVVPAAPGTYSYTVTADDGTQTCTSTTTLTVYALPTITAPLTTLCVGTNTTLTGSGTAASSSAWVSSSTGVATVNTSGTVNAVSTGTTTITYTDNHACTATQTMTVVANPTASISGSTTVCSGGSANISFSGTPSATVTYQINGGTNQTIVLDATGNASLPSGNLSATTTFTMVSVQVSPPSGCSATISGSATITVGNPPTVDPLNAIEICLNESVTVPAFSSTPTGATFAWTNDNTTIGLGANGTGNVSSFTSIASGVANISVVPTLNGCVGPAMVFTITVNPLPTADAGTDASFCEGESTTIGVASSSGNTYSWSPSNGLSSTTSSNPTVSNLSEGVYNYTVTITDASGCVATDVVDVTVMPTPIAQFSVNPTVVTLEDPSVTTENTSIDALTYFWNFGDGFTSTQINPAHVFPQVAGVFPITLTATNGTCVDSITHVVEISEQLILYVPNAFTPDGDEYNNVFLPILNEAYDYQNYTFDVFNRWGELIFTSNNPLVGWDGTYHGKLCKEGQYIWRIEVKRKNKDEHFIYTGHINLLY